MTTRTWTVEANESLVQLVDAVIAKHSVRYPTPEAFLRAAAENFGEHLLDPREKKSAELTEGELQDLISFAVEEDRKKADRQAELTEGEMADLIDFAVQKALQKHHSLTEGELSDLISAAVEKDRTKAQSEKEITEGELQDLISDAVARSEAKKARR